MATVTGGEQRTCPLHTMRQDRQGWPAHRKPGRVWGRLLLTAGKIPPGRSRDEAGGVRLTGEGPMPGELVKAVLERALGAELTAHLGYERHHPAGHNTGNSRNGTIGKKVQTGIGPVGLAVPRDRAGTSGPLLVPNRAGRISGGLDDMIISLYAHGMSVRDILHHLEQVHGTQLSRETVSRVTGAVPGEVRAWQGRPLDPVHAVVFPARSWPGSATTTSCRTSRPERGTDTIVITFPPACAGRARSGNCAPPAASDGASSPCTPARSTRPSSPPGPPRTPGTSRPDTPYAPASKAPSARAWPSPACAAPATADWTRPAWNTSTPRPRST